MQISEDALYRLHDAYIESIRERLCPSILLKNLDLAIEGVLLEADLLEDDMLEDSLP
jgi:hypothetical protein